VGVCGLMGSKVRNSPEFGGAMHSKGVRLLHSEALVLSNGNRARHIFRFMHT
jgi:hypothetical protein